MVRGALRALKPSDTLPSGPMDPDRLVNRSLCTNQGRAPTGHKSRSRGSAEASGSERRRSPRSCTPDVTGREAVAPAAGSTASRPGHVVARDRGQRSALTRVARPRLRNSRPFGTPPATQLASLRDAPGYATCVPSGRPWLRDGRPFGTPPGYATCVPSGRLPVTRLAPRRGTSLICAQASANPAHPRE